MHAEEPHLVELSVSLNGHEWHYGDLCLWLVETVVEDAGEDRC